MLMARTRSDGGHLIGKMSQRNSFAEYAQITIQIGPFSYISEHIFSIFENTVKKIGYVLKFGITRGVVRHGKT